MYVLEYYAVNDLFNELFVYIADVIDNFVDILNVLCRYRMGLIKTRY